MDKISVVIPTIWNSNLIHESLEQLVANFIVGEILIIDNRPAARRDVPESPKIVVHSFDRNLYVNPAWNYGVLNSKYEKICLLNDDAVVDDLAFAYAFFMLDNPSIGVIGTSKPSFINSEKYFLEQIQVRNRGFGTMMFFNKTSYTPIPEDLKIWFGDDWMIKSYEGRVFRMRGPYIKTEISSSSGSPEFQSVIDEDIKNSIKYQLPWSNDYE
jgi:glycosyltransferase involved in cell wall biosynthesis